MSEYKGEERRSMHSDHDLLNRIDVTVTNIGKNQEEFMDAFKNHVKEDDENLMIIHKRINEISRYVFIGIGIVAALEFASYFLLKK